MLTALWIVRLDIEYYLPPIIDLPSAPTHTQSPFPRLGVTMDNTALTKEVAHLFRISGYNVDTSVKINHREIDIRAEETQGLVRKTILVECADYTSTVGVAKVQNDIDKLRAAKEQLKDTVVLMHVSRNGYSSEAFGYALDQGIQLFTLLSLTHQLVNFSSYIQAVENDQSRDTILNEYQPTKLYYDGRSQKNARPAIEFLNDWIQGPSRWLTVLGDYGVGKSWMLKRFLYHGIELHKSDPSVFPLPLFVPLQHFTKAFDYQNLILRVFQLHGLAGVPYVAFEHLASTGRVLFLFDSFDEMAQHLHRDTIRENLKELLAGISGQSKAIMTSRPTYFESRAERLLAVETDGTLAWHPLDRTAEDRKVALSRFLSGSLEASQYARLMDLSLTQRRKLFAVVLGPRSKAYKTLSDLLVRFQDLGSISQRAVIARLLTTVAETLAGAEQIDSVDGYPLIPDDLQILNQGKIFEIVVNNLLYRDQQIGSLSAGERYHFLRTFAVCMQQPGRGAFAEPREIRELVERIFRQKLRRSEAREQLLEQYYRTCRRHSGLTTEGQFRDSTGQLDLPVEETDATSRVGFSHNSLREFLVADAFADHLLQGTEFEGLETCLISDAVTNFFCNLTVYYEDLPKKVAAAYKSCKSSNLRERLFRLLLGVVYGDPISYLRHLGEPAELQDLDLSGLDLSGLALSEATFEGSILPETDLRSADVRRARFAGAILNGTMLDGANLRGSDFSDAEVQSIFVFDEFDTKTSGVLKGRAARQWLFSHGANVEGSEELNPFLGKPWYEAAREVTRTLDRRIAGTHQDSSLAKGTKLGERQFAEEFVKYLKNSGVLEHVKKSGKGSNVIRVAAEHRDVIRRFGEEGTIDEVLQNFFRKYT